MLQTELQVLCVQLRSELLVPSSDSTDATKDLFESLKVLDKKLEAKGIALAADIKAVSDAQAQTGETQKEAMSEILRFQRLMTDAEEAPPVGGEHRSVGWSIPLRAATSADDWSRATDSAMARLHFRTAVSKEVVTKMVAEEWLVHTFLTRDQ